MALMVKVFSELFWLFYQFILYFIQQLFLKDVPFCEKDVGTFRIFAVYNQLCMVQIFSVYTPRRGFSTHKDTNLVHIAREGGAGKEINHPFLVAIVMSSKEVSIFYFLKFNPS